MCRKSMLVTTLRRYGRDTPDARVGEWFPDSYLFYPAKPDKSEREQFVAAYEARAAAEPDGKNVWILKPSDGGKGEGIVIKVRRTGEGSRARVLVGGLATTPSNRHPIKIQRTKK